MKRIESMKKIQYRINEENILLKKENDKINEERKLLEKKIEELQIEHRSQLEYYSHQMNENRKLIEELKKEIGAMKTSFKKEKILKEESQKLNKKYEEEINNLESEKDKIKKELDIKILKLNDKEEAIQEIINSNNIFNEYNDKIKQISQQKESELSQKI